MTTHEGRLEMKSKNLPAPVKCTAHNRHGEPCKKWAMNGQRICSKHGGKAPQNLRAASMRLLKAADPAAAVLVRLATNATGDVPHSIQLAAARDILDRVGVGRTQQVEVALAPWIEDIEGLLYDVNPEDNPQVVPGEVLGTATPRALLVGRDWKTDDEPPLPSVMDDPPRYGRSGSRLR
jgi:hypothetical protein